MEFTLTREQYNELSGLAYHLSDYHYRLEKRDSDERITEAELENDRKNIEYHFPVLDKLGVPFWVQNIVLVWAEKWQNYAKCCLRQELEKNGVIIS